MDERALLIEIQWHGSVCYFCGAASEDKHGIAVGPDGNPVPDDWSGEWGGVAACAECYREIRKGTP